MAAKEYLDNTPNARKLLDSLRYLGYDNFSAICDIVDNSLDAEAQNIWIDIERQENSDFHITISDDGSGMNRKLLDQASRLGSETSRNAATDLGRFGMGLVTASLSIGRRLVIVTRADNSEILSNITDFDFMTSRNQFLKEHFGLARVAEKRLFNQHLSGNKSGTVVQISKCDGFKRKYVNSIEKQLSKHIGQVYREFIRIGKSLFVNSEKVAINDPLWLNNESVELYSDEIYRLKYVDEEGDETIDPVRIRLVILPDQGARQMNQKMGYNIQKSGFYILRNNREIAQAQLLGLSGLTRHPDFIRFRGEIFITGRLDDALGIEFTKRDVKPIQSIRNQIDDMVGGNIKSIRKQLQRKSIKTESFGVDHTSSERLIDSKSRLLIKPAPRHTPEPNSAPITSLTETKLGAVKFRISSFGREGPIYAAEQQGRTIFVDWNSDHPFYERFVLDNRDNQEKLNAVDALVFSMAVAELRAFDEESLAILESWKTLLGSNLRILLS